MKTILTFLTITILSLQGVYAQKEMKPVKWNFEAERLDDDTFLFTAIATTDKGWYIYSQDMDDEGPVPTTFSFDQIDRCVDKMPSEHGDLIKKMDPLFEVEVSKYTGEVSFRMKYTSDQKDGMFSGTVTYMCCDNEKCLPPTDIPFKVSVAEWK